MGLRDVSRQEAIDLGLIDPAALLEPKADPGFNLDAEIRVDQLPPAALDLAKKLLGDSLQVVGDLVRLAA